MDNPITNNGEAYKIKLTEGQLDILYKHQNIANLLSDFYINAPLIANELLKAFDKTSPLYNSTAIPLPELALEFSIPHFSAGIYVKNGLTTKEPTLMFIEAIEINMYKNTPVKFIAGKSFIHQAFYDVFVDYFSLY
ncbi:hypothetical protein [Myroides sp. TSA_177.3]|uniref:hypothetical protein n=1 Tax=Myroides sp. TSA_177.3 TaxID=3415650 RepID=UPI004045AE9F